MPVHHRTPRNFATRIAQLLEFKKRFGHTSVPISWSENKQLANWVKSKRWEFSTGKLDQEQISALEAIGFEFTPTYDPIADAQLKLDALQRYRLETNDATGYPTRHDPNAEYAAVAAWIHRQRRLARGGTISSEVQTLLAQASIDLNTPSRNNAVAAGTTMETAAFDRNIAAFQSWLSQMEQLGHPREITYKLSKKSAATGKIYRFIEHLVVKARQGILTDDHRERVIDLECLVNGRTMSDVLNPAPSLRTREGRAVQQMKKATAETEQWAKQVQAYADRCARDAERAVEKARKAVEAARLRELEATEAANKAINLAYQRSAKAREEAARIEEEANRRIIESKRSLGYAAKNVYLTAAELSRKMNYNVDTIRSRFKDKVFIENVHYIVAAGGRPRYIWNRIEADLLAGKLDKPNA